MPNLFAYLALITWPFLAKIIKQKMQLVDATILLFLLPYLLLPVKTAFDFPLLPAINKDSLASIMAFFLLYRVSLDNAKIKFSGVYRLCLLSFLFGPIMTIFLNSTPLEFTDSYLPGLKAWDFIGVFFTKTTSVVIPFCVGYLVLNTACAHRRIVYWIAFCAVFYTLPMLWEIRMSPQLHAQFYGFFPHQFAQQVRAGGFRPVVFLGHGLLVAFFAYTACICAFVLMKNKVMIWRIPARYVFIGLFVVVFLCKTMGVVLYLFLLLTVLLLFKPKTQFLIATIFVFFVSCYPAIREASSPQLRSFTQLVSEYNEDRAKSFAFRLNNEDELLAKAGERKWFGWGSWGRNLIYDYSGQKLSVIDGQWIIVFSAWGWVGYLSFFGLFFVPLYRWFLILKEANRHKTLIESADYSAVIGLILMSNMIDFIPNSSLSSVTLLMGGALAGRAVLLKHTAKT